MPYEELEIAWVAAAIFFGFGQAVVAIILSLSFPKTLDETIAYFEWVIPPMRYVMAISFVSLFFTIVMTWVYFCSSCRNFTPRGLIICLVITSLGIAVFLALRSLIKMVMLSRLRPEQVENSDIAPS